MGRRFGKIKHLFLSLLLAIILYSVFQLNAIGLLSTNLSFPPSSFLISMDGWNEWMNEYRTLLSKECKMDCVICSTVRGKTTSILERIPVNKRWPQLIQYIYLLNRYLSFYLLIHSFYSCYIRSPFLLFLAFFLIWFDMLWYYVI